VFDVETNCRDGDELPIVLVLEEIDDGRLSAIVKSYNQDADLLRAPILVQNLHEHLAKNHFPEFIHFQAKEFKRSAGKVKMEL
jgi:hypothetical protein